MNVPTPIRLGGYPAKLCARRTHNLFRPDAPPEPPVDADVRSRMDAGIVFEATVNAALVASLPVGASVLCSDADGWDANVAATVDAMRRRVPVIINGRLPDVGPRTGAPDVLVLAGDGYLPVDVKHHRTLSKPFADISANARSSVSVSPLGDPAATVTVKGPSNKGSHWRDDTFQLAHYTRMLQDLGFHPGDHALTGGIIGTSDLSAALGDPVGIVWYDLASRCDTTYSASSEDHRATRSMLDRYDHEFSFRLQVAHAAAEGGELVRAYRTVECDGCPWATYCASTVPADDASWAITTGNLTVREWQTLYDGGTLTVTDLAGIVPDETLTAQFVAASVTARQPERRLTDAIRRARMALTDTAVEPHDGVTWPTPPTADVEVDFDIEWDTEDRIYLWGLRVRDGQDDTTAQYLPVVSFEPLDDASEAALADQFTARLSHILATAQAAGRTVAVFHWHHVEVSRTRRFEPITALLEGRTTDLMAWVGNHLFGRHGLSLKHVAPGLGFTGWEAVADAGGAESQRQIVTARSGGEEATAAQAWLLGYNAADVAAQAHIRDALAVRASAS